MRKNSLLVLCNLGISVVFLLSLYSYTKGMTMFSLFLAMAVFGECGVRAVAEQKFLQEDPQINNDRIYRVTKILRFVCAAILIIGVWKIRLQ